MARLPVPGQDANTWGTVLNDFLGVEHNPDGTLKKSDEIAAAASNDSVVHNAGNETVGGVKTFSSSPIVPTPTTPMQATNKAYVDNTISTNSPVSSVVGQTGAITGTQIAADPALAATYARIPALNAADFSTLAQACAAAAGRTLILPDTYTASISSAIILADDTRIRAEGGALITVPSGSANGVFILGNRCQIMGGLTIDGGGAKTSDAHAIRATGKSDCVVEIAAIKNWHGNGIYFVDSTNCIVQGGLITNITRSGSFGCGVQYKCVTGDTINPQVRGVTIKNTAGSALQMDGEWNRSDWRTAGRKVRFAKVSDCHFEDAAYAGCFLNSAFDSIIANCTAKGNGDYGVGYEYSLGSRIDSCTGFENSTFGLSLFVNNDGCTISNSVGRGNAQHGIFVVSSSAVSGDTASSDNTVSDCKVFANTLNGLQISGTIATAVSNVISYANGSDGVVVGTSTATRLNQCISHNNSGGNGFKTTSSPFTEYNDCNAYSNAGSGGFYWIGNSGAPCGDGKMIGCTSRSNSGAGIYLSNPIGMPRLRIQGGVFSANGTKGINSDSASTTNTVRITGAEFYNNGGGEIYLYQPFDCTILSCDFTIASTRTGIEMAATTGGVTGGRYSIKDNTLRGGSIGVLASFGASGTAGDDVVISQNTVRGATTPYSWGTVGTTSALAFSGFGSGVPVVPAGIGSIFYRTDGSTGTSLYVKESGIGLITGWVAK